MEEHKWTINVHIYGYLLISVSPSSPPTQKENLLSHTSPVLVEGKGKGNGRQQQACLLHPEDNIVRR